LRKLHNEELHNFVLFAKWARHVERVWKGGMYIRYCWESQKERDHWKKLRLRWEDNVEMDLRDIGWDGMYWIDLAKDREQWRALVNMVLNLRVP
jgi:hypothetical protein